MHRVDISFHRMKIAPLSSWVSEYLFVCLLKCYQLLKCAEIAIRTHLRELNARGGKIFFYSDIHDLRLKLREAWDVETKRTEYCTYSQNSIATVSGRKTAFSPICCIIHTYRKDVEVRLTLTNLCVLVGQYLIDASLRLFWAMLPSGSWNVLEINFRAESHILRM